MNKTKKLGIYSNELENGDKVFYFTYKDINDLDKNGNPKKKWVNVGKYSEGIREINAVNLRNEQINEMKHGEDISIVAKKKKKEFINLENIANIYFKDKKISKKQISKFGNHINPFFGNKNIDSITKKDILEFRQNLIDGTLKYPTNIQEKRNLITESKSPQTINGIIDLFKAIYNHYIKEYNLKIANPCFGISKLKTDNARERYLTTKEINLLLEQIESNATLWLFVKLSLSTGGRLETILNIQRKDTNLTNSTITLKNLKTNETYKSFLQPDITNLLEEYLQNLKPNHYLISFENHIEKTNSRQIQARLKPILDRLFNNDLDLKDTKNRFVIHSLRHTFASHLAINGTPIFTIKELMNHKDIEQTIRYAKLAPDSGKIFINNLYK